MSYKRVISICVLFIFSLTIYGCVTPESKESGHGGENGPVTMIEAFNKSYLKYKNERPKKDAVSLDPKVWTLLPNIDDEKMKELNQNAKYLSMIYNLSTIYTDMFFSDAQLSNYIARKEQEWKDKMNSDAFKSATVIQIEEEYQKFLKTIDNDQEYKDIENKMLKAKKEFAERAKELGKDAIIEALKKYLDAKGILKVKPPGDMNFLQKGLFVKSLKTEASKADTIISQATYTTQGTLLVASKATAKIIIATIKIADIVVTVALDSTGKILVTALDATGKAVELAVVGGDYVIKKTGEAGETIVIVLKASTLKGEHCVRGIGSFIGDKLARVDEQELFGRDNNKS